MNEDVDFRKAANLDEAEYANHFYRNGWVHNEYQRDRIVLFEKHVFNLEMPTAGFMTMLGTHNCEVFETWCNKWGADRCLGFELYNEKHFNNIVVMDVRTLGHWFTTPISLAWNDIGSWIRTPEARTQSYEWVKNNVISGGFSIERSDEIAEWKLSEDMTNNDFVEHSELLDGAYVIYQKL